MRRECGEPEIIDMEITGSYPGHIISSVRVGRSCSFYHEPCGTKCCSSRVTKTLFLCILCHQEIACESPYYSCSGWEKVNKDFDVLQKDFHKE